MPSNSLIIVAESRFEKIESSSDVGEGGSDPDVEADAEVGADESGAKSFDPVISASCVFTGSKSTKTKSLGIPGLFLGLLDGGLLVRKLVPAAEIFIELLKHSMEKLEPTAFLALALASLTRHNFLPLAGGSILLS